jgi:hypothetical protein
LQLTVKGLFEDMMQGFGEAERASFAAALERIAANLAAARQPEVAHG